jgi:hypothetical protein
MAACFIFGAGAVGTTIDGKFGILFILGFLMLMASLISSHNR